MLDFFQRLISSHGFMPHGHCYLWTPGILRLHVISDALIVLAYYSIPIVLVYFVRKRKDLMFGWVFLCFAIFILACGTTHLLEIWNVWHANYWLSGSMKALTALASVPTAILLTRLMPAALALEGPEKFQRANAALEEEIKTRRKAEEHARELNATLERRVAERTTELNAANGELLRQMAERKLADERFRLVVEASPSAIVLANAQGRILLVNSGAEKLFGHNREELTGQPVEILVPERFRAGHPAYRAGYVQHPETRPMGQGRDLFALRKDGSEVPVEIGLSPIQTVEGTLVLSAIVDITERKGAEEALRASELDFRASFYSSAVGQAQVEPGTGQYLRVNPKFCEIAGYPEEELLGMTFRDLTHPDDRVDDGTAHERMVSGEVSEVSREKRYLRKDGRTVWVNINASLIRDAAGRPLRTLAVVQDITERKKAEEAQRSAEEKFRCLVEQSLVGIYVIQGERFTYVNPKMAEIHGCTPAELTSAPVLDFICEEDRPRVRENIRNRLADEIESFRYPERAVRRDGTVIHVEAHGGRTEYNGRPAILGTLLDITERKRAEEALSQSEARFAKAFRSNPAAMCITTVKEGRFIEINERYCQLFDYTREELIGRSSLELALWADPAERALLVERIQAHGPVRDYETHFQRKNRDLLDALISMELIEFPGEPEPVLVSMFGDITERNRAEEALRLQQEHSESLLRLSRKLERALTTADILKASREEIERTIGFNVVWFYLLSDWGFFKLIMADEGTQRRPHIADGELLVIEGDRMLEEIAAGKDIVVVEDARTDPRTNKAMVEKVGNRTIVNVPITLAGEKLGVIGTGSFGDEGVRVLAAAERDYLSVLASQLAAVIDRVMAATERERAEEALRASEERLRLITNLVPHGIFAKNAEGRYLFVNRALAEGCGFSIEEILGKNDFDLVADPAQAEAYLADDRSVIQSGTAKFIPDEPNTDRSGRTRYFQTTKIPFTVPETGEPAVLGVSVDITERKRMEEARRASEARLNFALETTHIGAWDLSLLDHTAHRTPIHDQIFGYEKLLPVWTYEIFLEHVLPEDRAAVERSFREATATQANWSFECRIRRADDEVRWIWSTGGHEQNSTGQPVRMSGIVQDITERRRVEEEIHKLNAELERRVIERTAQLEAANKELEAFSYSVSHDLRAPLRAIDGFSQAVMDDYGPQLPEEGQRYLQTIRGGAQKMGTLIDDLLTFSRLSRAPLHKQEVNTGDVVRSVLTDLSDMQEGRKIDLRIGELPACAGDPALLKQVWVNLLSNALKYTQKREAAVVEIGCEKTPEGDVYSVRDNGTGFDMRYAGKLFGVFQRLHRADEYEGTGVGLAIVQRVIHRHGGRIWAEAAVDRGATFYFTLQGETKP